MAEARIPVDLLNPGQVFACLGFLEAAEVLLGGAEGGFDWTDATDARFGLRAAGEQNPVAAVLETARAEWLQGITEEEQNRHGAAGCR
jgi:CRISPR-associated protein Csb3